jgi:D-glycero-D-manno-heptose 1,7-bisphosphate phosphatase
VLICAATQRRAVFLDRDGTILVEKNYLAKPEDVELIPGAAPALRRLLKAGYALIVVTNQSGIARGYYGVPEYLAVQARMAALLAAEGVTLAASEYCPHHPEFTGPCECRKPSLALFLHAAETLDVDPAASWWVGDRLGDVQPALRLGGRGILVRTGYGRAQEGVPPGVQVAQDLAAAAALILAEPEAG